MTILAPIALCFALYFLFFVIFSFSIPEMKLRYELWATLFGLMAVLPVAFTEYVAFSLPVFTANTFISVFSTALLFNGLIEESMKMAFMFFLPVKKLKLSTFFACCILCGLAFGSFESVIYMLASLNKTSFAEIQRIYHLIIVRLCTAVLIHTFCAGLSGLYIWTLKRKKAVILPFLLAVLFHGLYNFFASYPKPLYYFIIPVILFAAVECRIRFLDLCPKKSKTKQSIKQNT